jgi:hypothetical protein
MAIIIIMSSNLGYALSIENMIDIVPFYEPLYFQLLSAQMSI